MLPVNTLVLTGQFAYGVQGLYCSIKVETNSNFLIKSWIKHDCCSVTSHVVHACSYIHFFSQQSRLPTVILQWLKCDPFYCANGTFCLRFNAIHKIETWLFDFWLALLQNTKTTNWNCRFFLHHVTDLSIMCGIGTGWAFCFFSRQILKLASCNQHEHHQQQQEQQQLH